MPENENLKKEQDSELKFVEELCTSTWENIYRFIYFKVQNREEAEDITQETYMKAISYFQRDRIKPDKYMGFLRTVALNILRDKWRKIKREGIIVNFELINPMEKAIEDPTESSAQRMLIESALNQLSEEHRTVIDLRILKGYSVADSAKIMNIKEGNIRVLQHRALKILANILKNNN